MISISYPSKSPLNPILLHLNSSQVPSQPHPGLWMGVSPPSMSRLTSIQFLIVASLLHPHRVSPPPRSFLNWRIVSQLHPSPLSPYPRLKMCISTQSRSHLKPIQALRFTFLLCLSWILPQSGSWYLHLAYIQVTSHLHPGPPNCILVPSEHHLIPIQVSRCVSHLHPGPFSTGELYLSSILVPYHHIHVSRCASQLNPGPISTPSRFRELCLLSTQAPRFTFHLCLSWISPQSGSSYLHLAYIQVTSHLHPGPPNRILVPSKHHLKPIHVSRCVSHLHPGPFSTGELYLSSIL